MKFPKALTAQWVADFVDAKLLGNKPEQLITGINEIHKVESGDLSFVDFEKYYKKALNSAATAIIIDQEVEVPEGKVLLVTPDPFSAYIKIVTHFRSFEPAQALINPTAQIGEGSIIQPGAFIGNHVQVGKDCLIHPGAIIYDHTIIENRVIIHGGAIIGGDAFYFKRRKEQAVQYDKMESCGHVHIESDVEIGAGTTIDKGVSSVTRIGQGTKIDNQVHIGHDVEIGRNCLIAAQVGIAGTTILEDEVTLWGQVGVNKDLKLRKGSVVLAQSGVGDNLEAGKVYFGTPSDEARSKMKELAWIKRIPEIWDRLK